ncbi:MAG TPA: hypothetical protein VN285_09270 [Candidatus Deferrimicrobium sp.]|nr:hypothetical protein [Candidatus Deferrimicrobium sp.]
MEPSATPQTPTAGSTQPAADSSSAPEALYTAFANVRNAELSVYWTRYNIQAVINLGLIAAVLGTRADSVFMSPLPAWVVLAGVMLSLIWLGFTILGKCLFTDRWETYLRNYEAKFLTHLPDDLRMFTDVRRREDGLGWWKKHWGNLNILTRSVPILALVGWLLIVWSSWDAKPLDARISRLEAEVVTLRASVGVSEDVTRRLNEISAEIIEVRDAVTRLEASSFGKRVKESEVEAPPKTTEPR